MGKAAPWYILLVMLFSYAVRSVYVESSAMFVRGGVYRVVKESMGGFTAKLSVSALLFDYLLTGPISGVSAGSYLVSLGLDTLPLLNPDWAVADAARRESAKGYGAVPFAILVTLFFYRQNRKGLRTSSLSASRIMAALIVMGAVLFTWCAVTLAVDPSKRALPPFTPDLSLKTEVSADTGELGPKAVTGHQLDPTGFLGGYAPDFVKPLRTPEGLLTLAGLLGVAVAFGHSILAMSGEETLAQVYREVAAPKLVNFRRAAVTVFVISLTLTGGISFLAVMMIPDGARTAQYSDNLISGLAMNVAGPQWAKLLLNAFVVVVGFFILSGAVNTSLVGANGVLARVAEDGLLPAWLLRPHPTYGTSSRALAVIAGMQVGVIVLSAGNIPLLGEAYAFGVVWSFVLKTLGMVILRLRGGDRDRPYRVPLNLKIAGRDVPLGIMFTFALLLVAAVVNLLTKEVATVAGLAFTAGLLSILSASDWYSRRQRGGGDAPKYIEQFNAEELPDLTRESLAVTRPEVAAVAVPSAEGAGPLREALAGADPERTEVVAVVARAGRGGADSGVDPCDLSEQERTLLTAAVEASEAEGKTVRLVVVEGQDADDAAAWVGAALAPRRRTGPAAVPRP